MSRQVLVADCVANQKTSPFHQEELGMETDDDVCLIQKTIIVSGKELTITEIDPGCSESSKEEFLKQMIPMNAECLPETEWIELALKDMPKALAKCYLNSVETNPFKGTIADIIKQVFGSIGQKAIEEAKKEGTLEKKLDAIHMYLLTETNKVGIAYFSSFGIWFKDSGLVSNWRNTAIHGIMEEIRLRINS